MDSTAGQGRGGGQDEQEIERHLARRRPSESLVIEAQAFGYLAVCMLNGMPIAIPTTTGVAGAALDGIVAGPLAG